MAFGMYLKEKFLRGACPHAHDALQEKNQEKKACILEAHLIKHVYGRPSKQETKELMTDSSTNVGDHQIDDKEARENDDRRIHIDNGRGEHVGNERGVQIESDGGAQIGSEREAQIDEH